MSLTTALPAFQRTFEESNAWLDELRAELPGLDRQDAYRVLKGVLHTLRDQLTIVEVVDLGAQMPMLLRGMYLEGWRPARLQRPLRSRTAFASAVWEQVGARLALEGVTAEDAIRAVRQLLRSRISAGELRQVEHELPHAIRSLFHS